MENNINVIKNAVSVKNAILLQDNKYYYLVHYDTLILKINKENHDIVTFLPVTLSSQNAIIEALRYIGIYFDYEKIEEWCFVNNGYTKTELFKIWKSRRYIQPAKMRKSQLELNAKLIINKDQIREMEIV